MSLNTNKLKSNNKNNNKLNKKNLIYIFIIIKKNIKKKYIK